MASISQYQDTTFIFKIIQGDVVYIVQFVISNCSILVYYVILNIRTCSFRATVDKKRLKNLETETLATESLLIMEIKYSNIKILEYLVLIFAAATVNTLVPMIVNFNVININDIKVLPRKIMGTRIFSYTSIICIIMMFSMLKRTLVLAVEIALNFLLIKTEHIFCPYSTTSILCRIFLDKIHKIKRIFVNFLKSIGFYKFLYWFIRFQFYCIRIKYFGLRCKLRLA